MLLSVVGVWICLHYTRQTTKQSLACTVFYRFNQMWCLTVCLAWMARSFCRSYKVVWESFVGDNQKNPPKLHLIFSTITFKSVHLTRPFILYRCSLSCGTMKPVEMSTQQHEKRLIPISICKRRLLPLAAGHRLNGSDSNPPTSKTVLLVVLSTPWCQRAKGTLGSS